MAVAQRVSRRKCIMGVVSKHMERSAGCTAASACSWLEGVRIGVCGGNVKEFLKHCKQLLHDWGVQPIEHRKKRSATDS